MDNNVNPTFYPPESMAGESAASSSIFGADRKRAEMPLDPRCEIGERRRRLPFYCSFFSLRVYGISNSLSDHVTICAVAACNLQTDEDGARLLWRREHFFSISLSFNRSDQTIQMTQTLGPTGQLILVPWSKPYSSLSTDRKRSCLAKRVL